MAAFHKCRLHEIQGKSVVSNECKGLSSRQFPNSSALYVPSLLCTELGWLFLASETSKCDDNRKRGSVHLHELEKKNRTSAFGYITGYVKVENKRCSL